MADEESMTCQQQQDQSSEYSNKEWEDNKPGDGGLAYSYTKKP